jgi:hypothetical protein
VKHVVLLFIISVVANVLNCSESSPHWGKVYDAVDEDVESLSNLLCLETNKYNLKKWWSQGVMEMLLPMHLAYTSEFSGGQQTAGWLAEKATSHKTKFKINQKNSRRLGKKEEG